MHGRIDGHVWRKRASRDRHFLRQPPSWAVDLADLELAESAGVQMIELTVEGRTWYAPLAHFRKHGFEFDRGFGMQVGLGEFWWTADREPVIAEQLELL